MTQVMRGTFECEIKLVELLKALYVPQEFHPLILTQDLDVLILGYPGWVSYLGHQGQPCHLHKVVGFYSAVRATVRQHLFFLETSIW